MVGFVKVVVDCFRHAHKGNIAVYLVCVFGKLFYRIHRIVAADIEEVLNIKLFKYRKKFFVYGTVFFIMWQLVTASAEK